MQMFTRTGHESNYVKWWIEQQKLRKSATLKVDKIDIFVRQGVFSPALDQTYSSIILLNNLPNLEGKSLLDVGSGCGIVSVYGICQKASRVIATDPDPEAIANTKENLEQYHTETKILINQGDLFEGIDETFDVIAANLPIVDVAWPSIINGTRNIYARFIKELPKFLNLAGECYLTFASFGDIEGFGQLISNQPLRTTVYTERKFEVNWYVVKFFH